MPTLHRRRGTHFNFTSQEQLEVRDHQFFVSSLVTLSKCLTTDMPFLGEGYWSVVLLSEFPSHCGLLTMPGEENGVPYNCHCKLHTDLEGHYIPDQSNLRKGVFVLACALRVYIGKVKATGV